MTFHTFAGFVADVTATEIASGRFAVTVFALIGHPVAPVMRDRFLVFMAVCAISGGMAGGAGAAIMACFNAVTGGFPAKVMISRFLGLMTLFTKSLAAGVTACAGVGQLAGKAMLGLPVLTVVCWCFFSPQISMTGFTFSWSILFFVAVKTEGHGGAFVETETLFDLIVTGFALVVAVDFMRKNQVGKTCRFCGLLDFVVTSRTLRRMTEKTLFRGLIGVEIVALLTACHGCGGKVAIIICRVALVTSRLLFNDVVFVAEFEAH